MAPRGRLAPPGGSWLMVGILMGLAAVALLRVALAAVFGLVRLLLVLVAVGVLWFLYRRAKRGFVRRR